MPTNRVRRVRVQAIGFGGITEIDYLYYSCGSFFQAESYENGKSKVELRDFWIKNSSLIMTRYMEEAHAKNHPGCRPWAWWKWSMPEAQRPVPAGKFSAQRVWDHQRNEFDWVETDLEYLKRLGLLEPWEKEVDNAH